MNLYYKSIWDLMKLNVYYKKEVKRMDVARVRWNKALKLKYLTVPKHCDIQVNDLVLLKALQDGDVIKHEM